MNAKTTSRLFALLAASMLALGSGCDAEAPCEGDESCEGEDDADEAGVGEDSADEVGADEVGADESEEARAEEAGAEGSEEARADDLEALAELEEKALDPRPLGGEAGELEALGDRAEGSVVRGISWNPARGCKNQGKVWDVATQTCITVEQWCVQSGYVWSDLSHQCFYTEEDKAKFDCERNGGMVYREGLCGSESNYPHGYPWGGYLVDY